MNSKTLLIAFFISSGLYGPENAAKVANDLTEQEVLELLEGFEESEINRGMYASSPTRGETGGTGAV
jgi:hypothetical protein